MAHELDMSNDRANMAYVGANPWHGLGQQLTEGADLETWKKEAGLDWMILDSKVFYSTEATERIGSHLIMPDRKLLYRSDTEAALSVVSADYNVVQPGEILDFYQDLVGSAGFTLETAGSLFGGRKFWALARCGESVRLKGQDEVKPYLLLASSCDGTMATVAHFTSVRVVCNNTLTMSIGANAQKAKVRVPHSTNFDHTKMKRELGIVDDLWGNFVDSITGLADLELARDDAIDVVASNLKAEWRAAIEDGNISDAARFEMLDSSAALRRIIQLYDGAGMGSGYRAARETGWGLVNAVTQYIDHETGRGEDRSAAFERANLGEYVRFKAGVANDLLARIAA